jgi:large subunit ribosomal protein L2
MKPGDIIYPGTTTLGSSLSLADIPVGAELCCIEANPGRGAVFARAAGSVATLLGLTNNSAIVQLPSDQVKHLPLSCRATLGRVSNPLNSQTVLGKAGASR